MRPIAIAAMSLIWDRPTGRAFDEMLDDIADLGYDGLSCFATELAPYIDRSELLHAKLQDRGLSLVGVTALLDDDAAWIRDVIGFMGVLGAPFLACTDFDTGLRIDQAAAILNERGAEAESTGVAVYYHNHTGGVAETASELHDLRALCEPDLVGSMLDVGHATKDFDDPVVGNRAAAYIEANLPPIDYLEFKDWNANTDLNTPLGEGVTDFARIVRTLRDRGYTGWITVEQNGNDGPSLGRAPRQSAAISRAYLRDHLKL
ncbi:sugar phosphate isomerase/epimerase family protein [Herbiconiux ginsengi]|uniref:sugar phosphate isomerase/epimerase family protein n=1 Tax=Herbiconiux ginsengi TaxID=381665 RepID=UPI001C31AD4A|nr:sugar phosphate isomerase/epimerase family protein [Herbiconiux ginsengi]